MKLEFVQVENFRQFYGKQIADFSTAEDVNVTVFHGLNGAGKTSLFSALNWCLYENAIDDIGDLINRRAVTEASEGDLISACVVVAFIHEGHRFIAKRELNGKKRGEKVPNHRTDASLAQVKASGDIMEIPNMIGAMNAILPSNVRPYFFFDGEKMDDLTKADSKEVEDAIRNFVRLPALERGERHLQDAAAEFRRTLKKKGSAELETLINKEEEFRKEKETSLKRLDDLNKEIVLARDQIRDLEDQLRTSDDASQLQKRRDAIEENIKYFEDEASDVLRQIQQRANRGFTKYLRNVVRDSLSILDEKRKRGEIPSGIREQFIKDLLKSKVCICGTKFSEDDEIHEHLKELLKRSVPAGIENEILNLGGELSNIALRTGEWIQELEELSKKREEIYEKLETLRREDDNVKRQLKDLPLQEIAELEKKRSRFQRNLELYLQEKGGLERTLESIDGQIESLRKEIHKAQEKQVELLLLSRKEDLAQRAADALSHMKQEFIEETRKSVENSTKDVFDQLAWKQDQFQDIIISDDFRMEIIDRYGLPTRRELSAGERQVLSLSFICAMARIAGEEAPLVMDTPFGRLSKNHLKAVAEHLPDLTPQLILFVTDSEWSNASSSPLETRVGEQYELQFEDGCTTIREVKW